MHVVKVHGRKAINGILKKAKVQIWLKRKEKRYGQGRRRWMGRWAIAHPGFGSSAQTVGADFSPKLLFAHQTLGSFLCPWVDFISSAIVMQTNCSCTCKVRAGGKSKKNLLKMQVHKYNDAYCFYNQEFTPGTTECSIFKGFSSILLYWKSLWIMSYGVTLIGAKNGDDPMAHPVHSIEVRIK